MDFNAANADELTAAIREANTKPDEAHIINLTGFDGDYMVNHVESDLFGSNAFPIITSDITINGSGRIITRLNDSPPFRFFAVDAKNGQPKAKLTLKQVSLVNGNSGMNGGGALVNDGELILESCVLRNNQGSLGGAIYSGDGQLSTIIDSLFTRNMATEKGGALYGANTSRLQVKGSIFYDNHSPNDGSSIWVGNQDDVRFEACKIWDGITIAHIGQGDLHIAPSSVPIGASALVMTQQMLLQSAYMQNMMQAQVTTPIENVEPEAFKPTVPWWVNYTTPLTASDLLKTLEEPTPATIHMIERLIFEGQFDTLQEYGRAIQAKLMSIQSQVASSEGLFANLMHKLVNTPGILYVEEALKLYDLQQNGDFKNMARSIAYGQSSEVIIELFRRHSSPILEKHNHVPMDYPGAWTKAYILGLLVQELVIRGIDVQAVAPIADFIEKQKNAPYWFDEGIMQLPLKRLDIEDEIRGDKPELSTNSNFQSYLVYEEMMASPASSIIEMPVFKEIINRDERQRIGTALEAIDGDLEVRSYQFETQLSADAITGDFLTSLKPMCLQDTQHMLFQSVTPNSVMSVLFVAANNGGVLGRGSGTAYGRLKAWQSMGALVGAAHDAAIDEIDRLAKECQWFSFRAVNNWFANDYIDIGVAVLRPDGKSLALVAATASMD